jgi:shikimate dehydrogenase
MHQAALAAVGLSGAYLPLDLSSADPVSAIGGLHEAGFDGLNVTVPLKLAVMPGLVSLSAEARRVGAVNTLIRRPAGWHGDNTDALGFREAYQRRLRPARAVLVLGAGGAARAALRALAPARPSRSQIAPAVTLAARRPEAARALAGGLEGDLAVEAAAWESLPRRGPFDLIVNATSASSPEELGDSALRIPLVPGGAVVDLNYGRPRNHWLELAIDSHAFFADGRAMLAQQARRSFRLWTGLDAGIGPFRGALDAALPGGLPRGGPGQNGPGGAQPSPDGHGLAGPGQDGASQAAPSQAGLSPADPPRAGRPGRPGRGPLQR